MDVIGIILIATSLICIAVCCIMLAVAIRLSKGFNINVTVTNKAQDPLLSKSGLPFTPEQLSQLQEEIDKQYALNIKKDDVMYESLDKALAEINTFMTGGSTNEQDK